RVADVDDWTTRFVTQLRDPLEFAADATELSSAAEQPDLEDWAKTAAPGSRYPIGSVATTQERLRFKKKGGGVISMRVPGGEVFARVGDKAEDPARGEDAVRLIEAIKQLHAQGETISHLEINAHNH